MADDIVSGVLQCRKCKQRYPIREGVAHLVTDTSGSNLRYEEGEMCDRYLWSHYADLCGDAANAAAIVSWEQALKSGDLLALDAGCAVGRLTFTMAARSRWAVGCDLSLTFVKAARRLARERRLDFSLPREGNLRETFRLVLPPSWRSDNLEFIVADALRLPFARETFPQSASLNLLDRVAYPLAHLYEMNRTASASGAAFLFASPFSWSTSPAPEELWLGGKSSGRYPGAGMDNVRALLSGEGEVLRPPWHISRSGTVTWQLRSHCRHRELITSEYLLAER